MYVLKRYIADADLADAIEQELPPRVISRRKSFSMTEVMSERYDVRSSTFSFGSL